MVLPASTKLKNVPLKLPPYVYDPQQSAIVLLSDFLGTVYIIGRTIENGASTFAILHKIACAELTVNPPNPIYVTVPDYVNELSLDNIVMLYPSSVVNPDTQIITDLEALFN